MERKDPDTRDTASLELQMLDTSRETAPTPREVLPSAAELRDEVIELRGALSDALGHVRSQRAGEIDFMERTSPPLHVLEAVIRRGERALANTGPAKWNLRR